MARVNWNKENIQQLKVYGDLGQLDDFAKLIKCTPNAAKIKYGREFGNRKPTSIHDKKAASIYNRMYPKVETKPVKNAVKEACEESGVNPFVIEQVPFTGARSTPEIVIMLAKQMLSINANKLDSIYIPNSIADSKKSAGNIFQQAKNYIAKTNQAELVYTIKSNFSGDAKKTYLSARIWRLK
jgi:hypothetical protein